MVLLITLTGMNSKVMLKMYVDNIHFCSPVYAKLRANMFDRKSFDTSVLAKQLAEALYTKRINMIYGNKRNIVVGGSSSMYLNDVLANLFTKAKVAKVKSVYFSFLTKKKKE